MRSNNIGFHGEIEKIIHFSVTPSYLELIIFMIMSVLYKCSDIATISFMPSPVFRGGFYKSYEWPEQTLTRLSSADTSIYSVV